MERRDVGFEELVPTQEYSIGIYRYKGPVPDWEIQSLQQLTNRQLRASTKVPMEGIASVADMVSQLGVFRTGNEILEILSRLSPHQETVIVGTFDSQGFAKGILGPIGFSCAIIELDEEGRGDVPLFYTTVDRAYEKKGLGTLQTALLLRELAQRGIPAIQTTVWEKSRRLFERNFQPQLGDIHGDGLQDALIPTDQKYCEAVLQRYDLHRDPPHSYDAKAESYTLRFY